MKAKIILGVVSLVLCVLSGMAGAYSVVLLQEHRTRGTALQIGGLEPTVAYAQERKTGGETLQVRRLELTDRNQNVRAVFAVEDDGSVSLRMLSKENVPVVELGVNEDPGPGKLYVPSGKLTIRDGSKTPIIQLGTYSASEGTLLFSSANAHGLVAVGYQPTGDVIDGHDHGLWGVQVKGPNHDFTIMGVRTEDGIAQEFISPKMTSPNSARSSPSADTSLHGAGHTQSESAH